MLVSSLQPRASDLAPAVSPRCSQSKPVGSKPVGVEAFYMQGISLADLMPRGIRNDSTLTVTGVLRRYARPFQADWSIPSYKF